MHLMANCGSLVFKQPSAIDWTAVRLTVCTYLDEQVLSYLDFFPTGVQRVATATAANMCRALTPDNAGAVQEAVPMLTGLLQYSVGRGFGWANLC